MWFPVKTPKAIRGLFPQYIWSINTDKKELYLTFDDGPTPEITPWVLEQLKQYNAKATFFCIGNNIEKHPKIFEAIIKDGHSIGNHTYHHLNGWKNKTSKYIGDVSKCRDIINSKIVNQNSGIRTLFRPPYGKLKPSQSKRLRELGYNIVMWDVLSYDWETSISDVQCYHNVVNASANGSIVVFHDSVKAYKNLKLVLPKVLEYYKERGFVFQSLTRQTLE